MVLKKRDMPYVSESVPLLTGHHSSPIEKIEDVTGKIQKDCGDLIKEPTDVTDVKCQTIS